jgi:hypothetical protein
MFVSINPVVLLSVFLLRTINLHSTLRLSYHPPILMYGLCKYTPFLSFFLSFSLNKKGLLSQACCAVGGSSGARACGKRISKETDISKFNTELQQQQSLHTRTGLPKDVLKIVFSLHVYVVGWSVAIAV